MTDCERCGGTGWEGVEVDGVSRVQRCACWQAEQRAVPAPVPREFEAARWDTWQVTPRNRHALEAARTFASAKDEQDLYLCGPVGTGKTRLACTVLNEAWRAGERSAVFARVPLMLYRLQPRVGVDEPADLFESYAEMQLLVLDDLGAERDVATDYTKRMLLMLCEMRRDAGRRTIWTSNRTPRELAAFMGDNRLASRIAGWCRVVELGGRDWRRRGAAQAGGGERCS